MEKEKKYYKEDEIDLLELFYSIWNGRKVIVKFFVTFSILGLFIAVFSSKEYTAKTIVIPQTKSKTQGLGGLAAIAGVDIGGGNSSNDIPPTLYPKVVQSVPFLKQLLKVPLKFEGIEKEITYEEYYKNYKKNSLLEVIKKYTVGLPEIVLGVFKSEKEQIFSSEAKGDIYRVTKEEKKMFNQLKKQLIVSSNIKEGFVSLSFSMPEPNPSARMSQKALQLLQEFITEFKVKKAKEELLFIEDRYKEAKEEFTKKQYALAKFRDRNRGLSTSTSMTRQDRLQSDYNLAYSVYSELAKRLNSQKIVVKENTPIFTVLEPVTVPVNKSKPNRAMILIINMFLGVLLGIGYVFGRKWFEQIKEKKAN